MYCGGSSFGLFILLDGLNFGEPSCIHHEECLFRIVSGSESPSDEHEGMGVGSSGCVAGGVECFWLYVGTSEKVRERAIN